MQAYWEYKKLHLLYIILFAMILWGSEYVRRNLWKPDEARYAYVANEMKQTGIVVFSQHAYCELPVGIRAIPTPHTFNMGNKELIWCEFNTLKQL